ncbi:MAG: ferritin [bacterium]|jgi:ferritin
MISKQMAKAINDQVNKEIFSSYLYLAMSANAISLGFKGAGTWFKVQFQEELEHALKFYNYLLSQGEVVEFGAIDKPTVGYKALLDMYVDTLKHEKLVTKSLNALMDLAVSEKDYATQALLQWYITEQIEEEANDADIIAMIKMAGTSTGTLFMVDKQLGKRGAKAG